MRLAARTRPGHGRGRAAEPTGMTAVLGGDEAEVLAAHRAGTASPPANATAPARSSPPGTLSGLDAFAADPPARRAAAPAAGRRRVPHRSTWPRPSAALDAAPRGITVADPAHDAAVQRRRRRRPRPARSGWSGSSRQVAAPVRWDLCMATLAELGVTALIELPPGRHAGRPGQAGAARASSRSPSRPPTSSTRPAQLDRRAPRRAATATAHGHLPDMAAASSSPRRRHVRPLRDLRASRRPRSPPAAALGTVVAAAASARSTAPGHAPRSSSGWSRTGTRSAAGSRWPGCSPREA